MHDTVLVGVEDMEPNHWIAWVPAIPGCYASARSRAEALRGVPAAIEAETGTAPTGPVVVAEEWRAIRAPDDSGRFVNACFAADRDPLTRHDITMGIQRLREGRRALLRLIEPRDAWHDAEVRAILAHIVRAESRYLAAMGWPLDPAALPAAPLDRLAAVRAQLENALPRWEGSAAVASTSGEEWTPRKVLRRAIWHERDHSQQIATMLAPD